MLEWLKSLWTKLTSAGKLAQIQKLIETVKDDLADDSLSKEELLDIVAQIKALAS